MLDGLTNNEMNSFLEDQPQSSHLLKSMYVTTDIKHEIPSEPNPASIKELQQARDALERELEISQRVKASTLKDVNLGSPDKHASLKLLKTWSLKTARL